MSTQLELRLEGLTTLHLLSNHLEDLEMVHLLTDPDLQDPLVQQLALYTLQQGRTLPTVVHHPIVPLKEDR